MSDINLCDHLKTSRRSVVRTEEFNDMSNLRFF